jgi:hypothetical protein
MWLGIPGTASDGGNNSISQTKNPIIYVDGIDRQGACGARSWQLQTRGIGGRTTQPGVTLKPDDSN